jgi:hypothetical protein
MSVQMRPNLTVQATHPQTHNATHQCQRCGITISSQRYRRNNATCTDCTDYYPAVRRS